MDDLFRIPEFVDDLVPIVEEVVQVADDGAEVLAGGDGAPPADGVKAHRNGALGQQRRGVVRVHFVRVIDAEHHERRAVLRELAVLARPRPGGELVGADDVLRPEVAGAEAVDPPEKARHLVGGDPGYALVALERLVQRGADIPPHRVVARHRLVRALEDDDVPLAGECGDDIGHGERPVDIDVNRADGRVPLFAQIVDRRLDILRGRAERDEHGVRVLGLVLADQAIGATGQFREVPVGGLEERENRLDEVVPAGRDTQHVVFLILDRSHENGVGQVDHLRHAAALRSEEHALALRGTVDHVFRSAEVQADQFRFVLVEGALEMGGEEAVHHVHPRGQTQFRDPPQDKRLVRGLLGVLAKDDDPAGVEGAVDVVMAAMDVQRVLGERASRHFQDHRRALAGSVVILLDTVDDPLARGVVDDPFATDGVCDGAALRRVFAFGFDGYGIAAKGIELPLGKGLLVQLTAFRGRRDRVEDSGIRDAGFRVVGNELIAVGGDSNAWEPGFLCHK